MHGGTPFHTVLTWFSILGGLSQARHATSRPSGRVANLGSRIMHGTLLRHHCEVCHLEYRWTCMRNGTTLLRRCRGISSAPCQTCPSQQPRSVTRLPACALIQPLQSLCATRSIGYSMTRRVAPPNSLKPAERRAIIFGALEISTQPERITHIMAIRGVHEEVGRALDAGLHEESTARNGCEWSCLEPL